MILSNERVRRFRGTQLGPLGRRAPKGPPHEDPPKSGLRVSVCNFSSLRPLKQLFGCQRPLPKTCVFPLKWVALPWRCLILMIASVVKNPTMIRVTLLCGRVLSGRALWRSLTGARHYKRDPTCPMPLFFKIGSVRVGLSNYVCPQLWGLGVATLLTFDQREAKHASGRGCQWWSCPKGVLPRGLALSTWLTVALPEAFFVPMTLID